MYIFFYFFSGQFHFLNVIYTFLRLMQYNGGPCAMKSIAGPTKTPTATILALFGDRPGIISRLFCVHSYLD